MGPAQKLLDAAAAPTLERIRQDRRKAPTQIQPLLAYLETHLFDPDLDANQLKRACGVRDNSLPIYFHHAVSLPPYAYIEDCRLEIACRLLSATDLKIWQIAQLLGYSTLQVFSRAFHRWSGLRPSVFRRRSRSTDRKGGKLVGKPAPPQLAGATDEEDLIPMGTLRKAISGGLDKEEADKLARRLAKLYPESFHCSDTGTGAHDANGFELSAGDAWALLSQRSAAARRDLLDNRWQVASVDLFRMLIERSIESSRIDAERGLELAELAIDCVGALRGRLAPAALLPLQAEGWIWLANARRRAHDYPSAEDAIGRAEPAVKSVNDTDVRTAFLIVKSGLRMAQSRFDEAQKLADQAVMALETTSDPKLGVMGLAHRANLFLTLEQPEDAVADFWHARKLADRVDDKYLRAIIYQGLTVCLAKLGRHQQVARFLPIARDLFQEIGFHKALYHLEWTEAFLAWDLGQLELAEKHFATARIGFTKEDEPFQSAMVTLDLALLLAEQGRSTEVLRLVSELIPVFEGLKAHREALLTLRLLEQAVAAREVSTKSLKKIRSFAAKARVC